MKTFMEQYQNQIEPRIHAIDLFLKTEAPPYCTAETAKLLQISQDELQVIMRQESLSILDQNAFLQIMKNGSDSLCKMFARELTCGLPTYYTAEHISYIYDLDISAVKKAVQTVGIQLFSRSMLYILFHQIPTKQETQ